MHDENDSFTKFKWDNEWIQWISSMIRVLVKYGKDILIIYEFITDELYWMNECDEYYWMNSY